VQRTAPVLRQGYGQEVAIDIWKFLRSADNALAASAGVFFVGKRIHP
jgi:hypothetical protein